MERVQAYQADEAEAFRAQHRLTGDLFGYAGAPWVAKHFQSGSTIPAGGFAVDCATAYADPEEEGDRPTHDAKDVAMLILSGTELLNDRTWKFRGWPEGLAADIQDAVYILGRFPRAVFVTVDMSRGDPEIVAALDELRSQFSARGVLAIDGSDIAPLLDRGHDNYHWANTDANREVFARKLTEWASFAQYAQAPKTWIWRHQEEIFTLGHGGWPPRLGGGPPRPLALTDAPTDVGGASAAAEGSSEGASSSAARSATVGTTSPAGVAPGAGTEGAGAQGPDPAPATASPRGPRPRRGRSSSRSPSPRDDDPMGGDMPPVGTVIATASRETSLERAPIPADEPEDPEDINAIMARSQERQAHRDATSQAYAEQRQREYEASLIERRRERQRRARAAAAARGGRRGFY